MYEYQKESKRGTSNLWDKTIYSTVLFRINLFFVLLKKELQNNSMSENLESLDLKYYCQWSKCCIWKATFR